MKSGIEGLKNEKPDRSMTPSKISVPNKSPGYQGNFNSYKLMHPRNIMRSLEQDIREQKSRNVDKKPHQSSYFSKIIENRDINRGATPPFIKKKEHLKANVMLNNPGCFN